VLVLDMIEIIHPFGKCKYDTWRILLVKCYIDNYVHLRSCIRSVNSVLYSLQDRLETGTRDLTTLFLPVKKHQQLARQERGFAVCFSSKRSDGSIIYLNSSSPPMTSACSTSSSPKTRSSTLKTLSSPPTTPTT
jgi:hypothetical protein